MCFGWGFFCFTIQHFLLCTSLHVLLTECTMILVHIRTNCQTTTLPGFALTQEANVVQPPSACPDTVCKLSYPSVRWLPSTRHLALLRGLFDLTLTPLFSKLRNRSSPNQLSLTYGTPELQGSVQILQALMVFSPPQLATRAGRYTVFDYITVLMHRRIWVITLPSITVFECGLLNVMCYM